MVIVLQQIGFNVQDMSQIKLLYVNSDKIKHFYFDHKNSRTVVSTSDGRSFYVKDLPDDIKYAMDKPIVERF